jgi:hypothetical protein
MKIPNDENAFGKQQICDEDDNILSTEPYLLINATNISFDHLGKLMKEFHGVYIPAHMDKNSNSLLSNLGFISPDADFLAAELAYLAHLEELTKKNPYLKQCNIITDSDAHELGKINEAVNFLECESRAKEDILRALVGKQSSL